MNDMELLEQAKCNVQMVFEQMTLVESLGELKKSVEGGQIGIMMPDNSMLSLNMLSQEQIEKAKYCIIASVETNMAEARKFLSRFNLLTHKPATINQDFEDEVKDMTGQGLSQVSGTTDNDKCVKPEESTHETTEILTEQKEPENETKKPQLDTSYENLYKLYITENMGVNDIVRMHDTNTSAVYKALGAHGLVDLKKTQRKDAKLSTPSKRRA